MQIKNETKIYFAPLQESTDHLYRCAHAKHFGGVDKYFAPYIVRQNDGTVKKSHLRDIASANNQGYNLIPQILAGNSDDFLYLAAILDENGYQEINWNLSCPYPMVTNKGLGSGLLPHPDQIESILSTVLPKLNAPLSIKLRTGLTSGDEIYKVIEILNAFPLKEIILHPRTGKQLYRGIPDEACFLEVSKITKHPLIFNGDINSKEDIDRLKTNMGSSNTWMIGRGILKNPFLPQQLTCGILRDKAERIATLKNFHDEIFSKHAALLCGGSHLLMKMEKFWSYFAFSFPDPHKSFKRIKKASNITKYEMAVNENFQSFKTDEED